jgi:hypothetical protein
LVDIGLDIYDAVPPEAAGVMPEEVAVEFGLSRDIQPLGRPAESGVRRARLGRVEGRQ